MAMRGGNPAPGYCIIVQAEDEKMRTVLSALAIWGLFIAYGCWHPATVEQSQIRNPEQQNSELRSVEKKEAESVVLTNNDTTASFHLARQISSNPPPVLELSVTKVVNPAQTPVEIFVYLEAVGNARQRGPQKILVGNFSLYPPDQPGTFSFRASNAFKESQARWGTAELTQTSLTLEIKRINETRPWTPLKITISAPRWKNEERPSQLKNANE